MKTLLIILSVFIFQLPIWAVDTIVINQNAPNVISKQKGFDIDLLKAIYETNGEPYQLVESDSLSSFFEQVNLGSIGAGGISITEAREELYDFVPYMDSGIKAVTLSNGNDKSVFGRLIQFRYFRNLWSILWRIEVMEMCAAFTLVTFVFANIIWLCERNSDKIPDAYFAGIRKSIYFCIVTQSTVGYGDVTVKNRLSIFSVIIMIFFGISMFSSFTGLLAADLVSDRLEHEIQSTENLKSKKILVKRDTLSNTVAALAGANCIQMDSVEDCLEALDRKEAFAVLGDAPLIKYYCKDERYSVSPVTFQPHEYGFVFAEGDVRAEKFTRAILKLRENGRLQQIYNKWF